MKRVKYQLRGPKEKDWVCLFSFLAKSMKHLKYTKTKTYETTEIPPQQTPRVFYDV